MSPQTHRNNASARTQTERCRQRTRKAWARDSRHLQIERKVENGQTHNWLGMETYFLTQILKIFLNFFRFFSIFFEANLVWIHQSDLNFHFYPYRRRFWVREYFLLSNISFECGHFAGQDASSRPLHPARLRRLRDKFVSPKTSSITRAFLTTVSSSCQFHGSIVSLFLPFSAILAHNRSGNSVCRKLFLSKKERFI